MMRGISDTVSDSLFCEEDDPRPELVLFDPAESLTVTMRQDAEDDSSTQTSTTSDTTARGETTGGDDQDFASDDNLGPSGRTDSPRVIQATSDDEEGGCALGTSSTSGGEGLLALMGFMLVRYVGELRQIASRLLANRALGGQP